MKKRSKHTLSHYRMVTAKMGELFPIGCIPVLPGDTFQHNVSMLVRALPLNTPVMHPVNVRVHHFFVPNRILWDGWEDFITGGVDGLGADEPIPTTSVPEADDEKNLLCYLGVPNEDSTARANALPMYAFNRIYNEYYRDQDLMEERDDDDRTIPLIAWEKDYFTTARPWSQRGPEVSVPIGGQAPVVGTGSNSPYWQNFAGDNLGFTNQDLSAGDDKGLITSTPNGGVNDQGIRFLEGADIGAIADLSRSTGALNINEFRRAFAIQRYQEARARYGARFTEYLQYLGIRPSDARLQRPEYLGGGTTRLNFSEVLQTTPGAEGEAGVGDLYGHGIAGVKTNKYRRFFEEHGWVISLASLRPKAIYQNASHREWWKSTKEDFYQQELVHLGQQEIYGTEIHAAKDTSEVFGYQDRYDEYRHHPSQVTQDFRTLLNTWHLGRDLAPDAALNTEFVTCDPSDRIFQVTTGDNLLIMANHHLVARRLIPSRARPRIL